MAHCGSDLGPDIDSDYEDMEFLELSQNEEDNQPLLNSTLHIDSPEATVVENSAESAFWIDFLVEAYEREFKGQKKEKALEILHVQASCKNTFEEQVWRKYKSALRREILYQRAEEGIDELLMWSPTKPDWADRDRFFLLHHKRSTARLSEVSDELLAGFKGTSVKISVLVYSLSMVSSKDYERAKAVLCLGKRTSGLKDRAGADSNQNVLHLANELKQRNKDQFVKPLDASFTLRANYIQGSAAHLRDDLLAGPPPEHLKNLFITVGEVGAQRVLNNSFDDASVAETVNESIATELKEIEYAIDKVESSVAELRQKLSQLQMSITERKTLISAFKRSLKVTEREESRLISDDIQDCADIDHD